MNEDFLSRWSRRKRGEEPASAPPLEPAAEVLPADEEISAEELAALPAVHELTETTDLVAFLRKGVPLVLRNAALKRMWVLDPAIRDFVGDARDYAWDWNTPGGVPGTGPLDAGIDVPAIVRRVFGEPSEAAADQPSHENVIEHQASPPRAPSAPRAEAPTAQIRQEMPEDAGAAENDTVAVRRHGGALPTGV